MAEFYRAGTRDVEAGNAGAAAPFLISDRVIHHQRIGAGRAQCDVAALQENAVTDCSAPDGTGSAVAVERRTTREETALDDQRSARRHEDVAATAETAAATTTL